MIKILTDTDTYMSMNYIHDKNRLVNSILSRPRQSSIFFKDLRETHSFDDEPNEFERNILSLFLVHRERWGDLPLPWMKLQVVYLRINLGSSREQRGTLRNQVYGRFKSSYEILLEYL